MGLGLSKVSKWRAAQRFGPWRFCAVCWPWERELFCKFGALSMSLVYVAGVWEPFKLVDLGEISRLMWLALDIDARSVVITLSRMEDGGCGESVPCNRISIHKINYIR